MACEISPICDFLFGSIRKNLATDTVDVELSVWMVKGIYTYRKTTLWSPRYSPHGAKSDTFPFLETYNTGISG